MDKGDLTKARLELRNAIQIDPKYADAHYLLGQVEFKKGNYQQAFGSFKKAVELAPGNLDAQAKFGKLFLMTGDKVKAQERADLVLKADAKNTEGLLLQGSILMAKKEWNSLAGLMEKLIAQKVTKPDAYLMLAISRNGLKDTKGAEAALLDGAAKNPASIAIQGALADLYSVQGRVDDAAAIIKKIMEQEPGSHRYGLTLADLYVKNGRLSEAHAVIKKLASANPKNVECLKALAGFYIAHRLTDDAEKILKDAIKAVPGSFTLRFALSELYNGTGRSDAGIVLLKECLTLEKDPKNPEVIQTRNLLARTYFIRGELPEVDPQLVGILKVNARDIEATYLKGRIHLQRGEAIAAISAFRSVINDRPRDAEGYLFLANAHLLNREPKLALENLLRGERLEPDSLRVYRALARFSASEKEYRQAEERMARYLAKHPDSAEARIELGDLCRLGGDLGRAAAEYSAVKLRTPNSPIPYLRLSDLFAQQGNVPRAISEMETVVRKLATDNVPSALTLADLYTRAADLTKARQLYEELFTKYPKEWHVANDYACFLADNGNSPNDLERAWSLAKNVAAQRPDDPLIMDTLGWIEYRRGNYAKAVELLEKAGARLTGHQTICYHLGVASFQVGKKEQARSNLTKALAGGAFSGRQIASETLKKL